MMKSLYRTKAGRCNIGKILYAYNKTSYKNTTINYAVLDPGLVQFSTQKDPSGLRNFFVNVDQRFRVHVTISSVENCSFSPV